MADLDKRLREFWKSGGKTNTTPPPSTSGNSGVDQYVTDKTPESVAKAAGRAANGVGNTGAGSFGDYQSYIRQNGGYVPEGLPTVQTGIIQGTGKGKNDKAAAEAAAMNKQGWDNVQGLSGMSTQEVMDYYMGNGQRDYDKDMALAGAYLTDQYNQDKKNENSDYSRDVAQRKEDFLKDPNNLYALAMEEGRKNNWTDNEYAEFFDIMTKMQTPDYLGRTTDYYSGFNQYQQDLVDANRRAFQNGGDAGLTNNQLNAKARELSDAIDYGDIKTQDDLYKAVSDWMSTDGVSSVDVDAMMGLLDLYQGGESSGLSAGWKEYTPTTGPAYTNEDAVTDIDKNISDAETKADKQARAQVLKEGKYKEGTAMFNNAVADAKADILSGDAEYQANKELREEVLSDMGKENREREKQERAEYTRIGAASNTELSSQANEMLQEDPGQLYQIAEDYLANKYAGNEGFSQEDRDRELTSLQMGGFSDMDFLNYFDQAVNATGTPSQIPIEEAPAPQPAAPSLTRYEPEIVQPKQNNVSWIMRNRADNYAMSQGARKGTPRYDELVNEFLEKYT